MFAQNDGSTKAKAVPYNWDKGIFVESTAGVGKWYVVNLLNDMTPEGPFDHTGKTEDGKTNINVMVVNPLDESATIDVVAYIGDNETSRHFTLASGGSKSMTFGAGMFVKMGIDRVYLYLVMDVDITKEEAEQFDAVHVNVTPVENENSVVFIPSDFNWTNWPAKTEATVIPANQETWVKVVLAEKLATGKTFKFYAESAAPTTINAGISYDCPATSIQQESKEITTEIAKVLDQAKLDIMPDSIYVRIQAGAEIRLYAEEVAIPQPAPGAPVILNKESAKNIVLGTIYNLAEHQVYKVGYNTLKAQPYYYKQIEVTNNGDQEITIIGKATKTFDADGDAYSATSKSVTIPAHQTYTKVIDKTMLSAVGSAVQDSIWAIGPNANVTFKLAEYCTETNPCTPDDTVMITIPANGSVTKEQDVETQWYAVDIKAAKAAHSDIRMTMTANGTVNLNVDIAADCALGEPTQSYSGSSATTVKTLSYSLFQSAGDTIYIRVNADRHIEVKAEILNAIVYNIDQYSAGWSNEGVGPDINKAARIETDLTITGTVKAMGITLAGGKITIKNGGKLIVGKEGIKGSETVDQIVIEEGGNLMIDPAATTNNKPFITAYKALDLTNETNEDAVHYNSPKHHFIALPVENRENSPVGLYYSNWTYNVGWGAVDGFRHAFVGYDVTKSTAADYCGFFAGQLAPNQNQTLNLPGHGWHAFGNSWLVPLNVLDMIAGGKLGAADQAVYLYIQNPTTIAGVEYSIDYGENTKQYVPVTAAIIDEVSALAEVKPMEGFFLYTETATNASLIYSSLYDTHKVQAKRAEDTRNKVAAVIRGGKASDFVYMIEGEDAIAHKMESNGLAIYAEEGLAQIANSNLIGTILTIQTNNNTEYTLNFTWVRGEVMYLKDLVNGNIIAMTEDTNYTFTAEPNTVSERFQVVGRNNVVTSIENSAAIQGANKRLENGKVVIIKNGVKYDVLGAQL